MPSMLTLSAVGALSIAGAALGMHLGHAAIAEINPAYFSEPETAFHAALAANAPKDWDQVQAREYNEVSVPITSCIGCVDGPTPDYPVAYVPGNDPYIETAVTRWPSQPRAQARRPRVVEAAAPVLTEEPAPDPARERIVRYGSYPVTQEEAQAMADGKAAADPDTEAPPAEIAATQ